MELHDCINFILNSTQNASNAYFKDKLQHLDVTPIQYSILKCLWSNDAQTPTQLAQQLQVDSSTVTGLLERLERKGMIERQYSTEDRRSVYVCLKEDGRRIRADVEDTIEKANITITAGMTKEAVELFKKQCALIRQNAMNK